MVLDMLGGAMAYAYNYNMGRFQFDATQAQAGAHQAQNLRIAQWGLFREDCRDLFSITTTNMSSYMLISTMFLGFTYNFAWNRVNDIPMDPGWLMLFWNNCMYASMLYGILGVWLAMHGTISAHTAGVKVLTQAVRPPIPTAAEVARVGFDLAKYEAAGAAKMFRAPAVLGGPSEESSKEIPGAAMGGASGRSFSDGRSFNGGLGHKFRGDHESHRAQELLHTNDIGGPGYSAMAGNHIELFRQLQATYVPFESFARVSLLIATHHMLMCFAYFFVAYYMVGVQGKTTPSQNIFSAWAAVCATVASSIVLFKLDLFVGGPIFQIVKIGVSAAPLVGALATNLWVHNAKYLKPLDHTALSSTPIPAALPQWCAILAGCLHMAFEFLVIWQSRPDENKAGLPKNMRSVQYIDIFGWWDDHYEECEGKDILDTAVSENEAARRMSTGASFPPGADSQNIRERDETRRAQGEARRLSRTIQKIKKDRVAMHMTDAEMTQLAEIQGALDEGLESLGIARGEGRPKRQVSASSLGSSFGAALYLRGLHETELGQDVPFFINCNTGEVHWDDCSLEGKAIDLRGIQSAVTALQERRETPTSTADPAAASGGGADIQVVQVEQFECLSGSRQQSATPSYASGMDLTIPIFMEMPRRSRHRRNSLSPEKINSRHRHSSMPWKYFSQAGTVVVALWAATCIWTFYHIDSYYEGVVTPPPTPPEPESPSIEGYTLLRSKSLPEIRKLSSAPFFTQLPAVWPHKFFRPSAVACSNKALVLGYKSAVHIAEPPLHGSPLHIRQLLGAGDLPPSWRALAITEVSSVDSTCPGLLLLEHSGRAVTELPLCHGPSHKAGTLRPTTQRWPLGESLDGPLHSITPIDKKGAAGLCGADSAPWALLAVTERGEVIALCARGGQIEPMHMVLAAPTTASGNSSCSADEFLGLQLDEKGVLWVLSQTQGTSQAELHAYAMESGIHRGKWKLPSGRSWANGLCRLSDERGFIFASDLVSDVGAHPEMWWLDTAANISESKVIESVTDGFVIDV